MGFQFRYESLLNLRRHQKERVEIEHAKALGDFLSAEEMLQALEKEYEGAHDSFKIALFREAKGYDIRNYGQYLQSLGERMESQRKTRENLRYLLEKKRKELLENTKQYKVIEGLRDKDFEKWQKRENELEQKRINELATLRHGRVYV